VTELALFLTLLKDAALSLGGLGALPLIRQDFVATGLVTDAQIVQALAIGRLSTGPAGLWIVSLGYVIAGWLGAILALIACSVPPLVMIPATALSRRFLLTPAFAGFVRGASLATAGLLFSTGLELTAPDLGAALWWELALGAIAIVLTYQGRVHPGLVVIGAALAGVILAR
jgi:chromate transporter